ncbi:MAG: hypothetical protein U0521_05805 [Anaerolineae bacterium]
MAETVKVAINLPADLVRDANEFGLLTDETISRFLRAEIDKRVNTLVNEEIHAYRRERRSSR